MQEGMLFHNLYAPRAGRDIVQVVLRLHEALERDPFRTAWQRVSERHPILRTIFETPTIAGLAEAVEGAAALSVTSPEPTIIALPRKSRQRRSDHA